MRCAKIRATLLCVLVHLAAAESDARGVAVSGFIDVGYWAASSPGYGLTAASTGRPGRIQAATNTLGAHDGNDQYAFNDVELVLDADLVGTWSASVAFNFGGGANPTIAEAFLKATGLGRWNVDLFLGRIPSVFGIEQAATSPVDNRFITTSLLSPMTTGSLDGVAVAASHDRFSLALAVSNDDLVPGNTLGVAPLAAAGGGAAGMAPDVNNDRAVQGRLGLRVLDGLDLGVSAARSVWSAPVAAGSAAPDDANPARTMYGFDAAWERGPWSLRGEYVVADEKQLRKLGAEVPIRWNGYYFEGWYAWSPAVGVGARVARARARQATNTVVPPANTDLVSDYGTWSAAVRWVIADGVFAKMEYSWNRESVLSRAATAGREADNDVLALSVVASIP